MLYCLSKILEKKRLLDIHKYFRNITKITKNFAMARAKIKDRKSKKRQCYLLTFFGWNSYSFYIKF